MAANIHTSFSCFPLSSTVHRTKLKLSSRLGWFDERHLNTKSLSNIKVVKSCQLMHDKITIRKFLPKGKKHIAFAVSEDQESFSEQEIQGENSTSESICYDHVVQEPNGKSGLISFYGHTKRREDENLLSIPVKNQNKLLWLVGPAVLVASFVFPSLYLRRILSSIFEDSLLTDFLILFFTEAIFYCGVAVFLVLIHRLSESKEPNHAATDQNDIVPRLGYRVSSVAVLVLSLLIPTVTMGFVWPWTGPAASATLAPYLVGILVQFAFEWYANYIGSPSWSAIPAVFQVYRLHQLNRAAQLVTALSFTVRGAEMTPHTVAINGALSTLLNVLQFLGIISIWSLSSFVMRFLPSVTPQQ